MWHEKTFVIAHCGDMGLEPGNFVWSCYEQCGTEEDTQPILQGSLVTEHVKCVPWSYITVCDVLPALTRQAILYGTDHHHQLYNFPVL
jgi:hypothetical protein